ncbi:hypothetical protein [Alteromonas sp. C1M14]|uniref:hypothetical protein n=1 Tax=Alteromonas sp. C1M14 TaxID=2841567 RepID=UPI001C0A3771|nr:hypothetical protein [Alteromonas sp. C1M14]MBU2978042.1 hypothetical protein [Alteromonas sp. C1M14]
MALTLTAYQIAVLQEMDICVWTLQSDKDKAQPDSSHSSPNKAMQESAVTAKEQDPIAQMRAAIGTKPTAAPKEKPPHTDSSKSDRVTASTTMPFSKAEMGRLALDIDRAIHFLAPQAEPQWVKGEPLTVTSTCITFPHNEPQLSGEEKKALWHQLCSVF